ncbi:MAG: membrane protein insertion efficiency factor YidD [Candidatus Pacebacteria bacterium]|nr:membrane protein insertion efficiency factor YidD [Candidatus Paceibacterota bacterium]MBP9839375.1 membrane protein insertion efficiency factor YidD [Candidatus Paceibacterota bacterium]
MKNIFIKSIEFYQKRISIYKKPSCVFFPTCSEYTKQAIVKYGVFKGSFMGFLRILRCHPWQKNHIDPVK